ncbi:hypothetical protein AC00_2352 [Escherichia coli 1-250-04_S3_C1]|uniref:Uncharacterized protein n=1 Tax=Escherichia coli 1-250-04_S3_C1 TaxID=1444135 RepID=A0AAN4NTW1_ECOLX|nr:hypothetical protein AC00_2352 [Escherichia coli 1-250-04_S3_C1]KEO32809.1 hypothetical protein AC28_2313 [Escherichia coli 1-250-04_S3_C2]
MASILVWISSLIIYHFGRKLSCANYINPYDLITCKLTMHLFADEYNWHIS